MGLPKRRDVVGGDHPLVFVVILVVFIMVGDGYLGSCAWALSMVFWHDG